MIVMKDHPISQMYQKLVMPSWEGYKVYLFNATTPKDLIYEKKLEFGLKQRQRPFTDTEKAVWYSHFKLWVKCLNQGPLIVLEHDSKLKKPLPDMSKEGYKFLSYMDRDFGTTGNHISVGSGYYITPSAAERLISYAVSKPINVNSDGHIANILNYKKQKAMNDYWYIEQINIDGLNTIDHKNKYRNFIGQDYEKLDLSILPSI